MKLAKLIGAYRWMSTGKAWAEARIGELFGGVEEVFEGREMVNADRARIRRSKEVGEESEKIKNYHHYEYYRGEDFIENIPYTELRKYTVKDKLNELKEKERKAIFQL